MLNNQNSNIDNLLDSTKLIDLEELRKMPLSDRAKETSKRVHECRKKHGVFDCPSCSNFTNTNCPFNRLFKMKHKHIPTIDANSKKLKRKDFAESKEREINKAINKWKKESK